MIIPIPMFSRPTICLCYPNFDCKYKFYKKLFVFRLLINSYLIKWIFYTFRKDIFVNLLKDVHPQPKIYSHYMQIIPEKKYRRLNQKAFNLLLQMLLFQSTRLLYLCYNHFSSSIKSMQPKRDWATFNIRKVQRKGTYRPAEELGLFTPEFQFEKYPQAPTYTNYKKEKQFMIDYSVNEAILNSKAYGDLKNIYNQNKLKNSEAKKILQQQVQKLKKQKQQALAEQQRLQTERRKYQQLLSNLKERIIYTRQKNRETRELLQSRINTEEEYLSNIILSMRFQAEYYHDIDPDQMTYEQLLQLEEKIGSVCKGLPLEIIEKLPTKKLQENLEDQCTICFCGLQAEEMVIILPPCEHKFHDTCVKQWLSKEKICPLCKRQVQQK